MNIHERLQSKKRELNFFSSRPTANNNNKNLNTICLSSFLLSTHVEAIGYSTLNLLILLYTKSLFLCRLLQYMSHETCRAAAI